MCAWWGRREGRERAIVCGRYIRDEEREREREGKEPTKYGKHDGSFATILQPSRCFRVIETLRARFLACLCAHTRQITHLSNVVHATFHNNPAVCFCVVLCNLINRVNCRCRKKERKGTEGYYISTQRRGRWCCRHRTIA